MQISNQPAKYGRGDTSFQAVGGEAGLRQLVDRFYTIMENNSRYQVIWNWHPSDRAVSRDKLARFLSGWMGGPSIYREQYGPINIPGAHAHLKITEVERDLWLDCMHSALKALEYPEDFVEYLLGQLAVPAERIRVASGAALKS